MTMRLYKYCCTLLLAAAFAGCNGVKEELVGQEGLPGQSSVPTMIVQASTEYATRTALQKDGDYKVVWLAGDKILIGGNEFTLVSGAGTESAEFEGPQLEDGTYDAFYGTASDQIPEVQTYTAGQIANAPMKAQVTVTGGNASPVGFRNLGGLLRLTVMNSHSTFVSGIKVSGEKSDGVSINPFSYTLDCGQSGAGLALQGTIFYLAMPEGSYGNVTIEMTGTDGEKCVKSLGAGKKLSISRAQITRAEFSTLFYRLLNGHEYEDLGIPSGTKWATCNVGASYPRESGDYLDWSENAGKKWGDKWRTPTRRELEELKDFCYWVWTDSYSGSGMKGYIVYKAKSDADCGKLIAKGEIQSIKYSLSDHHIFLPAAGLYTDSELSGNKTAGRYWSASLSLTDQTKSGCLSFTSNKAEMGDDLRQLRFTVRPVYSEPVQPVPEYVDLGLSVYWATHNVGTVLPEGYGYYFAWGETSEKDEYWWFKDYGHEYNYKFGDPSYGVTKYGTLTTLETEDDAASAQWKNSWRMPTRSEMQELLDNCELVWENDYNGTGVKGYTLTSNKKGYRHVSIFLPAAGYKLEGSHIDDGLSCNYWSSTVDNLVPAHASGFFKGLSVDNTAVGHTRSDGCTVRAVMPK